MISHEIAYEWLIEKNYEWTSRGSDLGTYRKNLTFELNSLYPSFFFYRNKDIYILQHFNDSLQYREHVA